MADRNEILVRELDHFHGNKTNRPRRRKTLARHLITVTGQTLSDAEASALIAKLCEVGYLGLGHNDDVTFHS